VTNVFHRSSLAGSDTSPCITSRLMTMNENMTISQDVVPFEKEAFYHIPLARRTAFHMAQHRWLALGPEQVEHTS
jgi:hypothetical protein